MVGCHCQIPKWRSSLWESSRVLGIHEAIHYGSWREQSRLTTSSPHFYNFNNLGTDWKDPTTIDRKGSERTKLCKESSKNLRKSTRPVVHKHLWTAVFEIRRKSHQLSLGPTVSWIYNSSICTKHYEVPLFSIWSVESTSWYATESYVSFARLWTLTIVIHGATSCRLTKICVNITTRKRRVIAEKTSKRTCRNGGRMAILFAMRPIRATVSRRTQHNTGETTFCVLYETC